MLFNNEKKRWATRRPDNAMARKHKTKLQTIMNKETTQKLTIDQYVPD
jgi:hypothetical protein